MKLHHFVSLKRPDKKVRLVSEIRNVEYPLARPTLSSAAPRRAELAAAASALLALATVVQL